MNYQAILDRILQVVDQQAYMSSASHVDPHNRDGMKRIVNAITDPVVPAEQVRSLIYAEHDAGHIDRVHLLSGLHTLAASPKVDDRAEAARLAGEEEQAALELGGPNLSSNLAAVDRHRGVLAFLSGHYELALDYFTRALERQHNAMNLQNILCTLLRLGENGEALDLLAHIRRSFPRLVVEELEGFIASDPDLASLRSEGPST